MIRLLRLLHGCAAGSLLLLTTTGHRAQSTAGYGDWQLHLPTNQAKALAEADDRVYVAAEDAFFYFDKTAQHYPPALPPRRPQRRGRERPGLRLSGPAVAGRVPEHQPGFAAPPDGSIINLPDIARKEINGTKTINQVQISGRRAYLAASFGIVVVDLDRLEIRDSYTNIGPGGTVVQVFATAVANGTLFAATSNGLMRAALSGNPLDYRNWTTDLPARPGNPYRTLAVQDGRVVAGINGDRLYAYVAGTGWQPFVADAPAGVEFRQLMPSRAGLLVTDNRQVTVLQRNNGRPEADAETHAAA